MSTQTSDASVEIITDAATIASLNRGPITTAFSAPASCHETLTFRSAYRDIYAGHFGNTYFDVACFPAATGGINLLDGSNWDSYYYSPAGCPTGWSTATLFKSISVGYSSATVISIGPETTAALCCPSGFAYDREGHVCKSSISRDQEVTYFNPTNLGTSIKRGPVSKSQALSETFVVADGIPVWHQSSDSSVLAAVSTLFDTTATSASFTGSEESYTTSSAPAIKEPTSPNSSLSTGAKVGVGVAVPLIVIGLALGAFVLVRKRKRQGNHINGSNGREEKFELNVADSQPINELAAHYQHSSDVQYQHSSNVQGGGTYRPTHELA